jgi:hypothetical protein
MRVFERDCVKVPAAALCVCLLFGVPRNGCDMSTGRSEAGK